MSFWVVKYDIKSFATGADYHQMEVASPLPIRPNYNDREKAEQIAAGMCLSNGGEEIDVVLKNGKSYKGPRYVYRVAEDDKLAEEDENAEERVYQVSDTDPAATATDL